MKITEEKLLQVKEIREELGTRVEFPKKDKGLFLLPAIGMATTKQVANFYGVDIKEIQKIVQSNGDELLSDGYCVMTGGEVKSLLSVNTTATKIINKHGYFLVKTDNGFVKIKNRRNGLFPKRAILRVGMLLGNYKAAEEVRNQLLNIERKTPNSIKAAKNDYELSLIEIEIGQAFVSGDTEWLLKAMSKFNTYKKQQSERLENKL